MKMLERSERTRRKEASRRAFDAQAPRFDEGMCGAHARSLYPHVLRELNRAYAEFACAPGRCGGLDGQGAPRRPFRVLDLGCGTGALAELVLETLPACELTGVDLSEEMLRRARARLAGRATFTAGDSEKLPFGDASFDAVVCNDSFHHYPDPRRAAFEAWRVLAAGGSLIIGDTWQPQPARALVNLLLPLSGEGDVRIYSEDEMREILGAWFTTVEWQQVGGSACLVRARK